MASDFSKVVRQRFRQGRAHGSWICGPDQEHEKDHEVQKDKSGKNVQILYFILFVSLGPPSQVRSGGQVLSRKHRLFFHQQQVRQFSKINERIADVQERVSTGKNILRASDDPVAAVNLSVAKEQSMLLQQFQRNIESAQTRLNMTDQTLQESVNVLVRFSELITMARNGALNEEGHLAISTEMKQLKEVLLGLANTTDANGQGIFSGYNGVGRPFELAVDGSVEYLGNRGQNNLQISENMTIATNIDGGSAFMRINTEGGRRSLFDIVDLTINAVETASAFSPRANAHVKRSARALEFM